MRGGRPKYQKLQQDFNRRQGLPGTGFTYIGSTLHYNDPYEPEYERLGVLSRDYLQDPTDTGVGVISSQLGPDEYHVINTAEAPSGDTFHDILFQAQRLQGSTSSNIPETEPVDNLLSNQTRPTLATVRVTPIAPTQSFEGIPRATAEKMVSKNRPPEVREQLIGVLSGNFNIPGLMQAKVLDMR